MESPPVDEPQDGSVTAREVNDAAIPRQLGEYTIVREIGRGGMGVVYEAVQQPLGRSVALKVLPPFPSCKPGQVRRFQLEARAAARLHHTNIVPVYSVGEEHAVHYYAMELIQGDGLDDIIEELKVVHGVDAGSDGPTDVVPHSARSRRTAESLISGQFPQRRPVTDTRVEATSTQLPDGKGDGKQDAPAKSTAGLRRAVSAPNYSSSSKLNVHPPAEYFRNVARVGLQVAQALAYAHGENILHRDIKPSNLLLDIHGHVWITDFGLVKVMDSDDLTSSREAAGTLMYMAPERFDDHSLAESDIYSLGVTLYELLTLRPPFKDSQALRLMDRIRNEQPKWPSRAESGIPKDLRTIVSIAMEKAPQHRYPSAEKLAHDLENFLAGRPPEIVPVSHTKRVVHWCRRYPAVAALIGLVALLLTTVAILSFIVATSFRAKARELELANAGLEHTKAEVKARNAELERKEAQLKASNAALIAVDKSNQATEDFTLDLPDLPPYDSATRLEGEPFPLWFGIQASETPWKVYTDVGPVLHVLRDSLEQELHRPVIVKIKVFRDYHRTIEAAARGEIQLWRAGPSAYTLAKLKNPHLLLLASNQAAAEDGMIIVRADSGIRTLDDVKRLIDDGKRVRVVFGSPVSGSGRFQVQAELALFGIHADDVEWHYAGRHDSVAEAVSGSSDDDHSPDCVLGALKGPTFDDYFGPHGKTPGLCVAISHEGHEGVADVFVACAKPWVGRQGLDQEMVGTISVSDLIQKCLLDLNLERYQDFWQQHADGIAADYREKPPADWNLPIGPVTDEYYDETRENLRRSKEFFRGLADKLINDDANHLTPDMRAQVQQQLDSLDSLDLLDFDVLALDYLGEIAHAEIGKILGIDTSEVQRRRRQSLDQIRENVLSAAEAGEREPQALESESADAQGDTRDRAGEGE